MEIPYSFGHLKRIVICDGLVVYAMLLSVKNTHFNEHKTTRNSQNVFINTTHTKKSMFNKVVVFPIKPNLISVIVNYLKLTHHWLHLKS